MKCPIILYKQEGKMKGCKKMKKKRKLLKWLLAILIFLSVFLGGQGTQSVSAQSSDNASPDFLFPPWKPSYKPLRINPPSDQQSVITGVATPGWTATAVVNGNIFSSKVDKWGNVYINLGRTFPGGSEVIVYQLNPEGYIVDTIKTTMSGVVPPSLNAPMVNPVYTNETTVCGFSNAPNVRVTINGQNFYGSTTSGTGAFTVQLGRTYPVGTRIDVYGERDGQVSPVSTIFVQQKNIYIETPQLNPMTTADTVVTGMSNESLVEIQIGNNIYKAYPDSTTKKFSVDLKRTLAAGTKVTAYGVKEGQRGPSAAITVTEAVKVDPPVLNAVKSTDTIVTGSSNAPLVEIEIGNATYKAYPDAKTGKFSVNLGSRLSAGTKITGYAVKNGQRSSGTTIYVEQGVTLSPPQLNPINTTDNVLSGTSNAPIVEVEVQNTIFRVEPDASTGKFSVKLWPLPVGTKVTARAIKDGQTSSDTVVYVKQGIVVSPPQLNSLTSTEKVLTGESDADKVIVTLGGDQTYTAKPDPDTHKFSIQLDKTYPEGTLVSAYGIKSGVESSTTTMYVTKGNIQLKAPLINAVTTQDTTVSGTADPNTTIKLNISTDSYEAKVDAEGNFKVLLDHTYPVNSLISVYSTDGQHKSLVTNAKVVQGSFKLGVNMITDTDRILTGMALPNSKIKVQVGNRIYEGQASTLGTFMIQMSQSYKAGQNIEITATDPASGRTESKVIIVYPESPSINTILPGTSAVSGQASPNAFVVVQIGGQNYSGLANAAGYFFIAINPNDAVVGAEIAVTQISNNIESLPTRVLIGS